MKASDLARPPIQPIEAQGADTAICVNHKGLIREMGDKEGTVFYCPIGRMYWRYTKVRTGMNAPLKYEKSGVL